MKRLNGIADVEEAGGFKRPEAGGYVCRITYVEDRPEQEYLYIEYDFAEGEFKDYFRDLNDKKGFWIGNFVKSYKKKAWPFFKGFCTAVTESNKGFTFDADEYADERTLKNKLIGLVLGEKDYIKGDGSIGSCLYVDKTLSVDRIRKGDFKVPEYKHLDDGDQGGSSAPAAGTFTDNPTGQEDELPFK